MPSAKFKNQLRRIIAKNSDLFDALLEFERTKRIPKLSYKERVNFTIDADLMNKFRTHCEKRHLKMSSVIEKYIKEQLRLSKDVALKINNN